jgi:hypothetical protein
MLSYGCINKHAIREDDHCDVMTTNMLHKRPKALVEERLSAQVNYGFDTQLACLINSIARSSKRHLVGVAVLM